MLTRMFLTLCFTLPLTASADGSGLTLSNLQIDLKSDGGSVTLDKFSQKKRFFSAHLGEQTFTIKRAEESLVLQAQNLEVHISSLLRQHIEGLNTLELDRGDFQLESNKTLQTGFNGLNASFKDKDYQARNFSLNCQRPETATSVWALCFNHTTRLRLAFLRIPKSFHQQFRQILAAPISLFKPLEWEEEDEFGIDREDIENVRVDFSGGSFKLQGDIGLIGGMTLKAKGTLNYDEQAHTVTVNLESARVLFFSVKSRLLKALRNSKSPAIKVEGDTITITLSKIV